MLFNPLMFVVSRTIAQRRGASDQEASRLGIVGAVLKPPILGILAASTIAASQAPAPGTVVVIRTMQSFRGMDKDEAHELAKRLGLTIDGDGTYPAGTVIRQRPAKGKPLPRSREVTLVFK